MKSICDNCINKACVWRAETDSPDPPVMDCPHFAKKPMTNADKIRTMTDEELARFTTSIQADVLEKAGKALGYPGTLVKDSDIADSEVRWLDWLKQEVTGNV